MPPLTWAVLALGQCGVGGRGQVWPQEDLCGKHGLWRRLIKGCFCGHGRWAVDLNRDLWGQPVGLGMDAAGLAVHGFGATHLFPWEQPRL